MDDDGNDPIVIFAIINNFGVDRVLVDAGSAVQVLIYDAFKKMNLDESLLRPAGSIYDFANQSIKVKGLINLPINVVMKEAQFLIVDQPSAYNAIIDRPLMKKISMVTVVYCLTIKFPTPIGVGDVKANLIIASQCHIQSLQMCREAIEKPTKVSYEPLMGVMYQPQSKDQDLISLQIASTLQRNTSNQSRSNRPRTSRSIRSQDRSLSSGL